MTRKIGSGAWFAVCIWRQRIPTRGSACCGRLCGSYDLKNIRAAEPLRFQTVLLSGAAGLPEAGSSINQEESMLTSWMPRHYWVVAIVIAIAVSVGSAKAPAPELNPAAISYKLPNQVNWVHGENGADTAILAREPAKPGMYLVLTRWTA